MIDDSNGSKGVMDWIMIVVSLLIMMVVSFTTSVTSVTSVISLQLVKAKDTKTIALNSPENLFKFMILLV